MKALVTGGTGFIGAKLCAAWFLGWAVEWKSRFFESRPMITRRSVGLMGRDCDVDTTRARTELGWKTRVSYEEAIREIEAWVKENM